MTSHWVRNSLQLAKVRLCLTVALSGMFGYLLYVPRLSGALLALGGGVFFLACGAATLNSLQEQGLDRQLRRTKNRPLPQKRLSPRHCLIQGLLFVTTGLFFLHNQGPNDLTLLLGLSNLALYNLVYTPLKPHTTLAIIPGALSGAIPPLMGWLAAGGPPKAPLIFLAMATFLLWQIPHYWLVTLRHKQDYLKSHLPSLLQEFSEVGLQRLLLVWVMAYSSITLLFAVQPGFQGPGMPWLLLINIAVLMLAFCYQIWIRPQSDYRILFVAFNSSLIATMLIVITGRSTIPLPGLG